MKAPFLRIARPTRDLVTAQRMAVEGLGLSVIASFRDHDGFDGVILGYPGARWRLEFTHRPTHPIDPTPTDEDLIVLYLPDAKDFEARRLAMIAAGYVRVESLSPYWDAHGETYRDADGYRTTLCRQSVEV